METHSLVNASVVAARLGMAKSSIYRLARAGLIPSYAAGPRLRGRRFDLAEVKAALKTLAQQAVQSCGSQTIGAQNGGGHE